MEGFAPWIQLNLLASTAVEAVRIDNNLDGSQQALLGKHEVWLGTYNTDGTESMTLCAVAEAPPLLGPFIHACRGIGRYIRVVLPGSNRAVAVAEVSILAESANAAAARPAAASTEAVNGVAAPAVVVTAPGGTGTDAVPASSKRCVKRGGE